MSRVRRVTTRRVRGTGVGEVRRVRAQVEELEEAVAETRLLDARLEAEVRRLEGRVAEVAAAFLARR